MNVRTISLSKEEIDFLASSLLLVHRARAYTSRQDKFARELVNKLSAVLESE
ncbi:MAG: hypothetical protein JRN37_07600 [Nitrososphaerota archaeon]|nr:hypothetical protein [Nitrososphaerota archaeon]